MKDERILIIENESIIARDLEISLKKLGWQVCGIAHTGKIAVEKARDQGPDLLVVDIKLDGKMDGIDVVEEIARFTDIPVIYLTAFTDDDTLKRAKTTHPYGYIIKPFEERTLQVTIEMGLYKHRAEKKIREKDKWLELVIGNLGEAVIAADSRGRIRMMNDAARVLTGWTVEEAMGAPLDNVLRFVDEDTGRPVKLPSPDTLRENSENGPLSINSHTVLLSRDGTRSTIDSKTVPIADENGEVNGVLHVIHDITRRKELENQLRQSQKMEAIGTLAGGIAHDFNNILSVIFGYTELLLRDVPEEGKIRSNVEQVVTAARRARDLVDQILAFSRQSEHKKRPVRIDYIVGESLKLIRSSLPASIEIRQKIGADKCSIMADPTQIQQVIMNLCANAAYAMRDTGGVLEIDLDKVETISEADVELVVRDTGRGMDKNTMARIFEPYFTTKRPGEGTGMGLAVIHGIVKSHGGDIFVQSTPGKGTSFTVRLPLLEGDEIPGPETPENEHVISGTGHILFIDDEDVLVTLAEDALGNLGYRVSVYTDNIDALAAFNADPQSFDLVVTDYSMPHMTGLQFSEKIRALRPDIPIILCSGFKDTEIIEKSKQLEIDEWVRKPFNFKAMAAVIHKLLHAARGPF